MYPPAMLILTSEITSDCYVPSFYSYLKKMFENMITKNIT